MGSENARAIADLPERFNAAADLIAPNLAAGRGGKTALIDCHGALTYTELAERINRMAGAFARLGVVPGDRVLLCLVDTRDFPTLFLGAIKAGVIPVPVNTLLTNDDYSWILDDSGARAVFVTGELAGKWAQTAEQKSDVIFVSSEGGPWHDLQTLLGSVTACADVAPTRRDDIAFWLYTSGSTGRPKGAMHKHGSMRLTANLYARDTVGFCENDVVLSVAKQFFAYGLGNALTFPYAVGATVILHRDRATPQAITNLMCEHAVTILGGVPTFFANWLTSEHCPKRNEVSRLRFAISAGEALPQHLGKAFRERFGADILDGLGSTEMLHIFVSQRPGSVRYGCTGRPVDGYEVRLISSEGCVAVGELGELHVRGETSAVAYWKNPEKSAATFSDGWTATGDRYVADEEGWMTYAGRSDDMLKVGGIYVSPIEVEEALCSHPDVIEAAVIGWKDSDGLVKPKGFVVLGQGVVASAQKEAELRAHVKERLAPFKYPRWIAFLDDLPKTATGKIQRYRLRDVENAV